jgi:hypothetical protein
MRMEFGSPRLLAMYQFERDVYDHVHAKAEVQTTTRVLSSRKFELLKLS